MKLTWDGHNYRIEPVLAKRQSGSIASELEAIGFYYGLREYGRHGVWWTADKAKAAAALRRWPMLGDDARRLLAAELDSHAASRATSADVELPRPAGLDYLPYQKAGIVFSIKRTRVLIADQPGLGKTIQALGIVNTLDLQKVLIVCPAGIRLNWLIEAEKWLVNQHSMYVVDGGKDPCKWADQGRLFDHPPCVIVNYDMISKDHIKSKIMSVKWDAIVFDEAHQIKTPGAKRTVHCLGGSVKGVQYEGIVERTSRTVFMTGTPILNRPIEIYPILRHCMPMKEDHRGEKQPFMTRAKFMRHFCGGTDFGASRLDELQQMLRGNCMVRRLKSEVLPDLPPKMRQVITLEPDGEAARAVQEEMLAFGTLSKGVHKLKAVVDEKRNANDNAGYNLAVQSLNMSRMEMRAMLAKLRKHTALAKVPYVVSHVTDLLEDHGMEKLVIFAHHHEVIDKIAAALKRFGVVVVTGTTALKSRQSAVEEFQGNPKIKVFIGNMQAAGVGITLTAASTVVFAEIDWVPGIVSQAEDRLHRIGQKDSVLVQHILLDGSLDQRLTAALVRKQDIIDKALDEATKKRLLDEVVDPFTGDVA